MGPLFQCRERERAVSVPFSCLLALAALNHPGSATA